MRCRCIAIILRSSSLLDIVIFVKNQSEQYVIGHFFGFKLFW